MANGRLAVAFAAAVIASAGMCAGAGGVEASARGAAAAKVERSGEGAAIRLKTAPVRASVCLSGLLTVRGYTPFSCGGLPGGEYHLSVEHPRFESRSFDVELSTDDTLFLDLALTPKARHRAALRSLVVPGWGQLYAGSSAKGWTLLCGEIVAAGSAYLLRRNYQDEVERYDESLHRYEEATYVGDIEKYRREVEINYRNVERAHDYMKYATYVAGGVWAIAVLDAVVYDPAGVEVGVSTAPQGRLSGNRRSEPPEIVVGVRLPF
jgi:hypothetical protein